MYDEEVRLGTGDERIAVVNDRGLPLGIDKSLRLAQTFDTRSAEHVAPLLDSIEEVLAALKKAGIDAFPAYGTLLGAVRGGKLIGHDSDADLGYVSEHTHPVDVVRESFDLQRALADMGYADHPLQRGRVQGRRQGGRRVGPRPRRVRRLPDGRPPLPDGRDRHAVQARVDLPARHHDARGPRAAGPGEHRRVPHRDLRPEAGGCRTRRTSSRRPESTHRRLNGWFRGTRVNREKWDRTYSGHKLRDADLDALRLRRVGAPQAGGAPPLVVDIGCGRGADDLWLAERGSRVIGLDFVTAGQQAGGASRRPRRACPSSSGTLNLCELRSVLAESARARARARAARPSSRGTSPRRPTRSAARTCGGPAEMVLAGGGRLYLEFLVTQGEDDTFARTAPPAHRSRWRWWRRSSPAAARPWCRKKVKTDDPTGRRICRMVVEWHR